MLSESQHALAALLKMPDPDDLKRGYRYTAIVAVDEREEILEHLTRKFESYFLFQREQPQTKEW